LEKERFIKMKAIVLSARSHIRPSSLRRGFLLTSLSLLLVWLALCQMAQAVVPAPDGGYPGANTAEGTNALFSLTTGIDNTALGFQALYHNTTGKLNTAEGFRALFSNTIGAQNTATGVNALITNTVGNLNTATGVSALFRNTGGIRNTATGVQTLFNNTTGIRNTATGLQALYSNTIGNNNTANGLQALYSNTVGTYNTANGLQALYSNTTGRYNTANGVNALLSNTTGDSNTANGLDALRSNTIGSHNTALGFGAGNGVTTSDNVIAIGHPGANVSDSCFIGNVRAVMTHNFDAIPVLIDSAGQLGTASSSRRFKDEIKPMDSSSESILALKPVTFHYRSDACGTAQFGLIAEEVAEINPDLVVRDDKGEIYTVRYDAVNAMLLNEFLKEHRKVEKLEATVGQQQQSFESKLAELEKKIEALTSGLQKVSAQLEMNKPAPKTVLNQ
jgi:hypothetical protein